MKFVDDGFFKLEWPKGLVNQKLEEENHKFLSLDPQRNPNPHPHHHHHHHLYLSQGNQNYVAESEQGEEQSASPNVQFQHLLYGGRLDFSHHNLPPSSQQPKKRSSTAAASEHAKLRGKMAESSHHQQRLGAVGEIVEVQGGHIVRSIGRKDRHSKVCTAKGPRDRRVRLAAHTAIQFYDVQDRLGYDRPSKAVDWLIKKAQAAIDELAQNPAWHPTAAPSAEVGLQTEDSDQKQSELMNSNAAGNRGAATMVGGEDEQQTFHRRNIPENPNSQISSSLPPSVDSDSIADTIKSFFPVGASGEASSSAMQFQSFTSSDLMSRSSGHSQDLRLSLQSLQDPTFQQHQNPSHHAQLPRVHGQLLLTGTPLGFDASSSGWSDHHHHHAAELSRFQKFTSFGGGGDSSAAPYYFNPPPAQPLLQQLLGYNHNQLVSQRGPLQSSNTPSIRAWIDPSATVDQTHHHHHQQQQYSAYPISGGGFVSSYGGFPGFHIPARIQGDEEEHDGYSDKPSSASSDYRH